MPERAVVFIDGNNWYHALKKAGLTGLGWLNYAKVSAKVVGPGRNWIATRYYVGQVPQIGNVQLYADQRRYMAWMCARDNRMSVHYGRLEPREVENEFAKEVRQYLGGLRVRIDQAVYQHLLRRAKECAVTHVMVEKAVDVGLAVDLVIMAQRNEYDVAYILAADGDYTPAATAAQNMGKKVFAAAIEPGAQLAAAVYKFLPLKKEWLTDCFGE